MRAIRDVTVVVAVIVASVVVAVPGAWAQGRCSVATLKGSFGVVEQGTVVKNIGLPIPVPFPAANVAIVTYDGAGSLSATYRASYGGMILSGTVQGTYTVDADCTYTDSVPTVHIERRGTITGEGMQQEVRAIYTVDWIVGGGTRWKIPVGNCSDANLKGPYALFGEGLINPGSGTLPARQVGLITYNGRGNFYGSETVNLAGGIETNTFNGTYAVDASCAASAELTSSSGLHLNVWGVIVGEGVREEVRLLVAERGWIFVASLKRQ